MSGDKQLFAPVPLRAMAMDLSGLQLRVLICVAAHDRLSLVKGKGQGCRASNKRMSAMVGCHFSRLCSALSQLVDLDLLAREKPYGDKRMTVYRVIYTDEDRLLFGNVSPAEVKEPENGTIAEGETHEAGEIGCQTASDPAEIGCRDFPDFPGFPPEPHSQYIPLNGGRDSVETGEYNSSEEARFTARHAVEELVGCGEQKRLKAGRSRMRLAENVGAQLAMLERALNDGSNLNKLDWYDWIGEHAVCHENPALNGQAMRLADTLVDSMDEDEYRQWQTRYGVAA